MCAQAREVLMRRYPFTVPGFARLVEGGGSGVVERLRAGVEPLVLAVIQYLAPTLQPIIIASDELHTLADSDWPKEWWTRCSFVPRDAAEPTKVKEYAWISIEYSRWEVEETWAVQAFIRVAEVTFSLSADSDNGDTTITLSAERLPTQDINRIGEILVQHFGG